MQQINIDKALGKTEFTGSNGEVYVVEIRVTANAKKVRISQKDVKEKKRVQAQYL